MALAMIMMSMVEASQQDYTMIDIELLQLFF
jgi:hypothetical protein